MKPAALFFCFCWALSAQPQREPGGYQFNRFPFDKWAEENVKPQLRWNTSIEQARLSPHQRLVADVNITMDISALQNRHNSQIIAFVRIEDSTGHRYQKASQGFTVPANIGDDYDRMVFPFPVFFLPGDYVISMAVCNGRTLEHSFTRQNFHVAPLKPDPLPLAWRDLPPVEFVPDGVIPHSWYLPQLRSVVRLPLNNQRPVRIELLVNTTPSDLGSLNLFRANMQFIVPAMKVLMGIDPAKGSVGLSIADLNRRMLSYRQPELHVVNVGNGPGPGPIRGEWPRLRPALTDFSTAKVAADALVGESKMLDYFGDEVKRLLTPDERARALIVLSAPVYFSHQERAPLPTLPSDPGRRVFYIRYSQPLTLNGESQSFSVADDLERILKPRHARIFHVSQPEEFRKALGAILSEIAAM